MKVDFFDSNCLTKTTEAEFGLRDEVDTVKAFIDLTHKKKWICTVINDKEIEIEFRALDKCVIVERENGDTEKSCDAMLTYGDNIDFVELKEKRADWITEGREQLEKTIELFTIHHGFENFKHKRAFVANKKHPSFHVIDNETGLRFFREFKVRLNVEAIIKIK